MGGVFTKFSYKQLQTMKHALSHYMERDGISESDLQSEKAFLQKIIEQIESMKEQMN